MTTATPARGGEHTLLVPADRLPLNSWAMPRDRAHPAQSRDCYDHLRRLLMLMQVPPGSRMVETEWSKRLGVHRTSLREAMSMLAHEGLLRRGERGGFFVPLYESRDLDEIWAVRSALEVAALRMFAERTDADAEGDASSLDAAIDIMEQMESAGLQVGFLEADRHFHQGLVGLSGNSRLVVLYSRAPLPLMPSPLSDPVARRAVRDAAVRDHREIARLVRERRVDDAIERLETHLHQVHRVPVLAGSGRRA